MVSDTLTSEVATMSTEVWLRSKTSKMRRMKPCAMNMRVDRMLSTITLPLQAMDLTTFLLGTVVDWMRVPSTSGRREFRIITGMLRSMAGITVAGCKTFAPK